MARRCLIVYLVQVESGRTKLLESRVVSEHWLDAWVRNGWTFVDFDPFDEDRDKEIDAVRKADEMKWDRLRGTE